MIREYVIEIYDYKNGATSPIDIVLAEEGFSGEDYIKACENNADQEWIDMLHDCKVTAVCTDH